MFEKYRKKKELKKELKFLYKHLIFLNLNFEKKLSSNMYSHTYIKVLEQEIIFIRKLIKKKEDNLESIK